MLTILDGEICLFSDENMLILSRCSTMVIGIGIKQSNIDIDFQISSLLIHDAYQKKTFYPKLFELSSISLSFSSNPLKFILTSSESYVYCIMPTIFYVSKVFQDAIKTKIDLSEYKRHLALQYNEYIEIGKNFVIDIITRANDIGNQQFRIDLCAPILIIPIDFSKQEEFLRIDLGKYGIKCERKCQNELIYENIDVNLTNFCIETV